MSLSERVQEHAYQRRWLILSVLCFSLLVIVLDNSILNVAIPTLSGELDPTNSQLQWMVDSYTLVFAGLLLTAGSLGDRFGRRGALQVGLDHLRARLAVLGARDDVGPAHRDPRVHGHRRRVHHAGDALDHHQRLPRERAGPGDRRVGRHRGHRHRARSAHRRLPARALLLGLDLPREPPDRRDRAHRRLLPHPDVEGPERAPARPVRRGALDLRPHRAALRHHRSADRTAGPTRRSSLSFGAGGRAPRRVHLVGAHDRPPDARRPLLQEPAVQRREHRHHDDVLRAVRLDVPAHAVHAVRARLLAARSRHPAAAVRRGHPGDVAAERARRRTARHEGHGGHRSRDRRNRARAA